MKALRIALPPAIGLAVLLLPGGSFDLWPTFGRVRVGSPVERTESAVELIRRAEHRSEAGFESESGPPDVAVVPSGAGRSGAIRVALTLPGEPIALPLEWRSSTDRSWYRWVPRSGSAWSAVVPAPRVRLAGAPSREESVSRPPDALPIPAGNVMAAPRAPGVYGIEIGNAAGTRRLDALSVIVKVPFSEKRNGRLNDYHIGRYPTEGQARRDRYSPPAGFIEVTPANVDFRLSTHFRLGEFLTKDQHDVWPKYVVVDTLLLDKLELVMAQLNRMGVRAERMHVMSGFRTPQYNLPGVGAGRASLSRHQFGDGADVWVDNEGDGYISDLNGDGRRDERDAQVILQAVDSVEARYPELVGGAGVYAARPGVRGPFVHIDVRGVRARW